MPLILQEALRGLFYAPFYVALARDAFAAEGVEIRFTSSPHPKRRRCGCHGRHGRCVLGRTDAGDGDLSASSPAATWSASARW